MDRLENWTLNGKLNVIVLRLLKFKVVQKWKNVSDMVETEELQKRTKFPIFYG